MPKGAKKEGNKSSMPMKSSDMPMKPIMSQKEMNTMMNKNKKK